MVLHEHDAKQPVRGIDTARQGGSETVTRISWVREGLRSRTHHEREAAEGLLDLAAGRPPAQTQRPVGVLHPPAGGARPGLANDAAPNGRAAPRPARPPRPRLDRRRRGRRHTHAASNCHPNAAASLRGKGSKGRKEGTNRSTKVNWLTTHAARTANGRSK